MRGRTSGTRPAALTVADSDVLIDALRGRNPARARVAAELSAGSLATTAVNAFELLSGARSDSERDKVDALLSGVTILDLDEPSARTAATVRQELSGNEIGMADSLIAGICLALDLPLLTRNTRHFSRVSGLRMRSVEA